MATEMNFWKRLQAESPAFFVKIQNIAIWLGAVATSIRGGLALIPDITIPTWTNTVYGYIMVASVIAGIVAKTPMKDASEPATK